MLLKKIKLENIRSYLNQEVNFPIGSTLFSGDIGSGKSSILLAMDFALFGLQKDALSGNSLLRNGKNKGSVELHFSIDKKDIAIKRTLKRVKNSVTQDAGHIIINNEKKELTPIELKQLILSLLNYPKGLLTKTKSLIYRYTVYTPQEEMKHILLMDSLNRLDILRKVFNIDKYKRLAENSKIYLNYLKQRKSSLADKIADLDEKVKESKEKEREISNTELEIKKIGDSLAAVKKTVSEKKNEIKVLEEELTKINELKKRLELTELELKNKIIQSKENNEELLEIEKFISELRKDIKIKTTENLKEKISSKKNEIVLMETTARELLNKINELRIKKDNSEALKKTISELETCPVCKQKVGKDHKHNIIASEDKNIEDFNKNLKLFIERQKEAEIKLKELRDGLENLRKEEYSAEINNLKNLSLEEKEKLREKLLKQLATLKSEIENLNLKKEETNKELKQFNEIEKKYNSAKEELELIKEKERAIEIKNATLANELNNVKISYNKLKEEIEVKLKIRSEIEYLNQLCYWIDDVFINLVSAIEKNIMVKVHNDFNNYFEKWFGILIDNDLLKIRLGQEFTPIIEQDGHDIEYEYLSGGEKTAAALAYRLALNQIINNLSNIKTKDLIILDEPTDGFSNEQLDRIKFVLDELDMQQIILVSHDPKIESFVNNIIRLSKREHVTEIL